GVGHVQGATLQRVPGGRVPGGQVGDGQAGLDLPVTRRWIRVPTRVSTPTAGPPAAPPSWSTEATMPPGWSPGVASAGTVRANGTRALWPAGTSTRSTMLIQEP